MHVGHCRGAVFGDALVNLLRFAGYDVTREYYINDAGAQVDALARSAYLRYREALGEDIGEIPAGPLSRRLREAGRRGAGAGVRPHAAELSRGALAAAGARCRHRGHAGADQGGPGGPQRQARRVLLGAVADGGRRRDQDHHRGAAQEGSRLRGPAGEAQGPRRRRVGGSRADAVQVDRTSATTSTAR